MLLFLCFCFDVVVFWGVGGGGAFGGWGIGDFSC